MPKTTLTVVTPVGTFTRTTATAYTHVNVWASPRAQTATQGASGVYGRWAKDNGYGTTWHASEAAARNAAAGKYKWDYAATLVGTFAVQA